VRWRRVPGGRGSEPEPQHTADERGQQRFDADVAGKVLPRGTDRPEQPEFAGAFHDCEGQGVGEAQRRDQDREQEWP
jgi:hypothetical protein